MSGDGDAALALLRQIEARLAADIESRAAWGEAAAKERMKRAEAMRRDAAMLRDGGLLHNPELLGLLLTPPGERRLRYFDFSSADGAELPVPEQ